MNYITSLKKKNEVLENGLNELLAYVQSSKFYSDQNVNVADIALRIREIQSELNRI